LLDALDSAVVSFVVAYFIHIFLYEYFKLF